MRFSPYPWAARDMIGGNPALDFVNTASKWSSGEPVDRLEGAAGFVEWAGLAGLLDNEELARARDAIRRDPEGAAAAYEKAHALRRALWGIFSALAAGRKVDAADLAALGEWSRRAACCSELAPDGDKFVRRRTKDIPAIEAPVLAIAEAAEGLLRHGPLGRLHACGGENCEWLFLDLSKNGRRRWCSMATCGNEAKVKKFRSRTKTAGG